MQIWLRTLGAILVIVSVSFIAIELWQFRDEIFSLKPGLATLFGIVAAMVVYAFACLPLSRAWRKLMDTFTHVHGEAGPLTLVYARSQLGKYLPGNVFHLAGRHIMGRDLGYSHQALVLSTLYEFAGLLSAAGFFCTLVIVLATDSVPGLPSVVKLSPALTLVLPMLYLAQAQFPALLDRIGAGDRVQLEGALNTVLIPWLLYQAFFLLAGISLLLLVLPAAPSLSLGQGFSLWLSFALSWTVGFLTPGAPSGIGVREASLLYLLTPVVGGAQAAVIALTLRFVTVGGDLLFWLLAEAVARKASAS